jgi:DNA-binding LacI/PurR family transcriptional regulator
VSLQDVAKKAGVGTATVSRVLNGHPDVKSSTRARVLRAIEELKYRPNLHARTLAGGQNRILGVVLANLYNPFFADICQAIESNAVQRGYEIELANAHTDLKEVSTCVYRFLGQKVSGLALFPETEPEILDELREANIPVVLLDSGEAGGNITAIHFDHRKGSRMLVDLLYALGHRRMAFIAAPRYLPATDARRLEFLEMTARYSVEARTFEPVADGFAGGREATRDLFRSGFGPTAILCVNDWIAIGAIRELRNRGLSVPGDVSVTGFDNITIAEFCCPSLTTIHIPRSEIGRLVVEALIPDASGTLLPARQISLDPELVVRESTGVAPQGGLSEH